MEALAFSVEISTSAINTIRYRLSESLATLVVEATTSIRQAKVAPKDEAGGLIGNADGHNPERKRGWLWVMVTPAPAVVHLALSRPAELARGVLGEAVDGIVVTDRYGACSWLPLHRRQILNVAPALCSFLDQPEVEPMNIAAVAEVFSAGGRALRPAVIHRKLSYGIQSQRGGLLSADNEVVRRPRGLSRHRLWQSRLLTHLDFQAAQGITS